LIFLALLELLGASTATAAAVPETAAPEYEIVPGLTGAPPPEVLGISTTTAAESNSAGGAEAAPPEYTTLAPDSNAVPVSTSIPSEGQPLPEPGVLGMSITTAAEPNTAESPTTATPASAPIDPETTAVPVSTLIPSEGLPLPEPGVLGMSITTAAESNTAEGPTTATPASEPIDPETTAVPLSTLIPSEGTPLPVPGVLGVTTTTAAEPGTAGLLGTAAAERESSVSASTASPSEGSINELPLPPPGVLGVTTTTAAEPNTPGLRGTAAPEQEAGPDTAEVPQLAQSTAIPSEGGSDGDDGASSVEQPVPDDFNWERDFNTLPGSESVYAGIKGEENDNQRTFDAFPELVDVSLVADCEVVPEGLPIDFIMSKITERFDLQKPGMEDLEPGEVYVTDNSVLSGDFTGDLDTDAADPVARRGLRGLLPLLQQTEEGQNHRFLGINLCPVCKKAKYWKKCLKVRAFRL